jgi:hypothetical protein
MPPETAMLKNVPLLIIPFILYNVGLALGTSTGGDVWATQVLSVQMMSGGVWTMTMGDVLIVIALVLFFIEIVKATRTSTSVVDHMLSTFVFVAFLVEFLLVQGAAHSVYFTLMVIALIDLLAGFTVSIKSAGRDVTFTG